MIRLRLVAGDYLPTIGPVLRRVALLLAVAGSFGVPARAADSPAAGEVRDLLELLHRVEARYRALPPFKLTFTQSYASSTFGGADEARGTIHVVPPRRILWVYDDPQGQRGALDGDRYWFLDPVDKEVRVHDRDPAAPDPLAELLAGRLEVARVFGVARSVEKTARGRVLLELTPREPRDDLERALLEVDEKDGTVRRVEVIDPLGNRFGYRLGPPVPSPAPPESAFRLVVPPGYARSRD
jgi:outer membrane lipoprotein-sorting protein